MQEESIEGISLDAFFTTGETCPKYKETSKLMRPQLLVQSLQGIRAQILFAFLFAGHAMDVDELRTWTGRSRQHHYGHLAALCGSGLLAKQKAAHGRDVYLLGSEIFPALQSWVAQIGEGAMYLDNGVPGFQESQKVTPGNGVVVVNDLFKFSPTITTITTTKAQESQKVTPGNQETGNRSPEEFAVLTAALNEFQIVGKKRKQLTECEWVTADYVRAHVKYAQDERNWDQPVGMAITRMLEHMDIPEVPEDQRKIYKQTTVGKGKREQTIVYTFDVDQAAADFTGHRLGCNCLDCAIYRTRGEGMLCPTCKHFQCECEEP